MREEIPTAFSLLLVCVIFQSAPAFAADADFDALSLESAPSAEPKATGDTKIYIEGALGVASQRYTVNSQNIGRASLDFSYATRISPNWRAVISDRLDYFNPAAADTDASVNSLREAYMSWQSDGGDTVMEAGRINLRYGPAYGYNPTDFFRDSSLRVLTTADPFALRENRLGTVVLRAQRLWSGGSLSAAYSPKVADQPNSDGSSLDLGSTNNRNRILLALGTQFSQRINSQLLLYKEAGKTPTMGFNLTALLSDAAVGHMEWTHGRESSLASRALMQPDEHATRNRFSGGVTYTTLGKLSFTAEYQYNGFGLNQAGWAALGPSPIAQLAYLREALRLQELAPRQAYLLYVSQKNIALKDLDLTAYLRFNPGDNSRLAWIELRHHWSSFDLSLQLQRSMGKPATEFGLLPDKKVVQMLGTYYF